MLQVIIYLKKIRLSINDESNNNKNNLIIKLQLKKILEFKTNYN